MAIMRCMEALEWLGLVAGCGLVLLTVHSLLVTLVAPRHLSTAPLDSAPAGTVALSARRGQISSSRLTNLVWDGVRALVERVARRARGRRYDAADRILGLAGPLSLLTLFGVWYLTLFAGFALIAWPASHGQFDEALRLSGSSLLTLGVDVPAGVAPTAVAYLGGAAGLFTVALAIAYLPTIYGHYSRRESLMRVLESRGGAPAWGPEILLRQHRVDSLGTMGDLYHQFEAWTADVVETHSSYPWLLLFRSADSAQSWVVSLLAMLDAAAMHLALCPDSAPEPEARHCLRMGFTGLKRLADVSGIGYERDPRPDQEIRLRFEEFEAAVARMREFDFPAERTTEQAWRDFRGWRVNYEKQAYAFRAALNAVPALWSGAERPLPPDTPVHRTPERPEG